MIHLRGVRQNNLKNINVDIPIGKMTVVTGASGSGKSSLAFETLFAEGQRRFVDSLSTYARQFLDQMARPDADVIENIPPAIALEQRNRVTSSRGTVAAATDLYDYMRLYWARIGRTYCESCQGEVLRDSVSSILQHIQALPIGSRLALIAPVKERSREELIAEGLSRVWDRTQKQIFELDDVDAIHDVVVDRLVIKSKEEQDEQRLMDSIEQTMRIGLGHMGYVDLGTAHTTASLGLEPVWFTSRFACNTCGKEYPIPNPGMFSFNSPVGACGTCHGFGHVLEFDEDLVVPDKSKTLKNGAVDPLAKPAAAEEQDAFFEMLKRNKISSGKRYSELTREEKKRIWIGDDQFKGVFGFFEMLASYKYKLHVRVFIRRYQNQYLCKTCEGRRLQPHAEHIKVSGRTIADVHSMSAQDAREFFESAKLTTFEAEISRELRRQILSRLRFMTEVGVGYLTLNRQTKTLSGGEIQRINLANQLGSELSGTLYVLDEPSIGLHPKDTERLIHLLHRLKENGNTLVVVEHDLDLIGAADHMIEMGPLAGSRGGEVVAEGPIEEAMKKSGSLTGKYVAGVFSLDVRSYRRPWRSKDHSIRIEGAMENNLKDVDVSFPIGLFTAVTGVSGSGKSTLVIKTLYHALVKMKRKDSVEVGRFLRLYGSELVRDVVHLDQTPVGRSPRSTPITFLKIYDAIRKVYASQSQAIRQGMTPAHFSFNVEGGRCEKCKGDGVLEIEMHFLPDVSVPCDACLGKRFKNDVLDVRFRKKNIYELLHTTVEEGIELFSDFPVIRRELEVLRSVGLGYIGMGQSASTLSGGESQRLKIAQVLSQGSGLGGGLYIFDEPTTGLHVHDVKTLAGVLQDLVDRGNTVIIIEHNPDLISQADWVIDVGPGGGDAGGRVVAVGTPEEVRGNPNSVTGKYIR